MFNLKLSPATVIMLPIAIFLDGVGIIIFCFGLDDFGLLDIIGIICIDTWLFFQKAAPARRGGIAGGIQGLFTGKISKYLTPTLIELTPYVGVIPSWTISLLFNLRH